ncbi:hypothetical protein M422DRAFT_53382 [Sphaerobolus stellatus SS14]|uniref:Unplaced genomic scaffold SPHSTscaffold_167, whole genome shotgun sequence n=1 Tax=Sphaerobolus stellatus (strain SS14) TaxID=990650 RepID=A0A0C9V1X0_SPHS4|nr:hypothetical protein M422DRAFT_53382 [Sphaerobolus stellatus SS14]
MDRGIHAKYDFRSPTFRPLTARPKINSTVNIKTQVSSKRCLLPPIPQSPMVIQEYDWVELLHDKVYYTISFSRVRTFHRERTAGRTLLEKSMVFWKGSVFYQPLFRHSSDVLGSRCFSTVLHHSILPPELYADEALMFPSVAHCFDSCLKFFHSYSSGISVIQQARIYAIYDQNKKLLVAMAILCLTEKLLTVYLIFGKKYTGISSQASYL